MKLLFISSTFDDMHVERELLNLTLLPKMKNILEKVGENLYFAPLSFGVKQSDKIINHVSKKTLEALFHERDEVKPYMILFIGDKYGWIKENELLLKVQLYNDEKFKYKDEINEIDYLSLLSKKYEDRILFYIRELDDSEMGKEGEEKFKSLSCLDKEKMRKFKEKVKTKFPNNVRVYHAKYIKEKNDIVLTDNLALMVEKDLKNLLLPNLINSSNVWQKKATILPTYYFIEKNKYYYSFIDVKDDDSDPYKGYLYDSYPILTIINGVRGIGKTSYLANKFINSKNEKMPFVFNKDEYSYTLSSFLKQLVFKTESILKLKHKKYKNSKKEDVEELNEVLTYLIELIPLLNNENKTIEIYIDRANKDFLSFLLTLQYRLVERFNKSYYKFIPFRFYVVFNNDVIIPSINALFDMSHRITITRQNDVHVKKNIIKQIFKSYKEHIVEEIVEKIVLKNDSSHPLYLKMLIHRLVHDDYYLSKELKGREKIEHLVHLIDSFENDISSLAMQLIKEVAGKYDETFLLRGLMVIAYSFRPVKKEDFIDLFHYMKWEFDENMFEDIHTLLSVITSYSELSDTYFMFMDDNKGSISYLLNEYIKEKGYLKYLGSFSSYYLSNNNIERHFRIALKLAFVRISLAISTNKLTKDDIDIYMNYLMDVFFKVEEGLLNKGFSQKHVSMIIGETITYMILNGFSNAILVFIAFANNVVKENKEYEQLFKSYFYFIKTDFSTKKEGLRIVNFFTEVFNNIENTNLFGDYNNDFALWLKVKFTIVKVRYTLISSISKAKKELDDLLSLFNKLNINLPTFYKMQIYCAYLLIVSKSKDASLFEEIFDQDIFSYFDFVDPSNLFYLRKEELESIYKAKVYALIGLTLANCYGDDKKTTFVPLIDMACEIFENHLQDYSLTHFNSATYTTLIELEALATPMYDKDEMVFNSLRYDARKFYINSYFILEAESSYFYWLIMMKDDDNLKEEYYLRYLSRRKALAFGSDLKEAYKLYIAVYAEFMQFISDRKVNNVNYHLTSFYEALKYYFINADEEDFYDMVIYIAELFESARIFDSLDIATELYDLLKETYKNDEIIKIVLDYLYKNFALEEECSSLAFIILEWINNSKDKMYGKLKSLLLMYEL